jgi:hypothetical protein
MASSLRGVLGYSRCGRPRAGPLHHQGLGRGAWRSDLGRECPRPDHHLPVYSPHPQPDLPDGVERLKPRIASIGRSSCPSRCETSIERSFKRGSTMNVLDSASPRIAPGDCVRLPDGRIGRVREQREGMYRVRVRRMTSKTNHFVWLALSKVERVPCPKGWMSPEGYNRYLRETLAKRHIRQAEIT